MEVEAPVRARALCSHEGCTKINYEQEDCVLSMVQSESLAVWRDARAKPKRGVFVSRMAQSS